LNLGFIRGSFLYFCEKIIEVRLDIHLVEEGLLKTRSLVKNLIKEQKILVNGIPAKKSGQEISEKDNIEILEQFKFVSRAGYKLEKALEKFNINVEGLVALDLGASTGGFTDCLLQRGAKEVYGIDVGSGQMDKSIRLDERVSCYEKVNARYLDDLIRTGQFPPFKNDPEIVVADLSFISLTLVLPAILNCVKAGTTFVVLVKPQFELGKKVVNKRGIVTDNRERIKALDRVKQFCEGVKAQVKGTMDSPIKGGDGNVEYLLYFVK
jgi:23S rRNA (cytidine1920-2'-O)/16S rRNA (cytidine1409-2'-O)-methyltransferase